MIDFNAVVQLVKSTEKFFLEDLTMEEIVKKGQCDYVTKIDYLVQGYLFDELSKRFPDIIMLSEERKDFRLQNHTPTWILDPVDGTTNLIHHYQASAVSLALFIDGFIEFGCIFNPYTKEVFTAQCGKGAYLGEKPIKCTSTDKINKSLISIGTSPYNKEEADITFMLFKEIFLKCQDIRRSGSAALDMAYVASGRTDAFFEKNLKPWDYAAGSLLLSEAGGSVSDWNGASLNFNENCNILASNQQLHRYILDYLRQYTSS